MNYEDVTERSKEINGLIDDLMYEKEALQKAFSEFMDHHSNNMNRIDLEKEYLLREQARYFKIVSTLCDKVPYYKRQEYQESYKALRA